MTSLFCLSAFTPRSTSRPTGRAPRAPGPADAIVVAGRGGPLLALALATPVAAYALGLGALDLTSGQLLRAATLFAVQLIGMSMPFFLATLAVGLICVLMGRGATGTSTLQEVWFECWRTSGGRGDR